MKRLEFTVLGKPVAWARARQNGRRFFTAPKQASYKDTILLQAMVAGGKAWQPIKGPVALEVTAFFDGKNDWHPKRPDVDNIIKIVADALNGFAYYDDGQIVISHAYKMEGKNLPPRLCITVAEVEQAP